jgi:hypothetical protein
MRFSISLPFFIVFAFSQFNSIHGKFQVEYQWKSLSYENLPQTAAYNFSHPVPFGFARHKNRMFIGVPRRNSGVSSTLNFINLSDRGQDPLLKPYPNFKMNSFSVSFDS